MDIDKWQQLKEDLTKRFGIEEEGKEDVMLETSDGSVKQGTRDYIIMQTPMGRVKLALEKRPMVLDKTVHFSHRAGQAARTDYEFSETEFTYKLHAYKWLDIDEEWDEIDAENFA